MGRKCRNGTAAPAATSFGTSTSRAFGDAPWCAVIMADRAFATPPYIRGWGAYPAPLQRHSTFLCPCVNPNCGVGELSYLGSFTSSLRGGPKFTYKFARVLAAAPPDSILAPHPWASA